MKKTAIPIDEETLGLIDRLLRSSRRFPSRSALVRAAIRAYAGQDREERSRARETRAIRENQRLLNRQLRALEKEQATARAWGSFRPDRNPRG